MKTKIVGKEKSMSQEIEEAFQRKIKNSREQFPDQEHLQPIPVKHLQGVAPKGKSHQWELTNHIEIVHMCVVCFQQTKVIWRANDECFGYADLYQDFKGGPLMMAERPDLVEERLKVVKEKEAISGDRKRSNAKKGKQRG